MFSLEGIYLSNIMQSVIYENQFIFKINVKSVVAAVGLLIVSELLKRGKP